MRTGQLANGRRTCGQDTFVSGLIRQHCYEIEATRDETKWDEGQIQSSFRGLILRKTRCFQLKLACRTSGRDTGKRNCIIGPFF
jgi:hypothetical protein